MAAAKRKKAVKKVPAKHVKHVKPVTHVKHVVRKATLLERCLYIFPRALGIAAAGLFLLFAFDMLGTGTFWEQVAGVLMQLIPSAVLVGALIVAWRRECIGSLIFLVLGIISLFFFSSWRYAITFFIVTFPLLLTAIAFYAHHVLYPLRKK